MTRYLAVDVKDLPTQSVLVVTGTILLLALAVLVLQLAARAGRDVASADLERGLGDLP